jgi:hypothetical protein
MLSSLGSHQSFFTKLLNSTLFIQNTIVTNQYGLPNPTLYVYIPFRDGSYANWASGSASMTNLSIVNSPSISTTDPIKTGSEFMEFVRASSQSLKLPNYTMNTTATSFSVSLFVKFKSGNSDFANIWCITNHIKTSGSDSTKKYTWAIFHLPSSGSIRFEYARDGSDGIVRRGLTKSGIVINQWYHIVAIQRNDGSNTMELWIDGVNSGASISGTSSGTGPQRSWTSTVHRLAHSSYATDSATNVCIDDFRFYPNTVLTQAQITTLRDAKLQDFDFIN